MSMGKTPGTKPNTTSFGFGSSSTRFQTQESSTPGPGTYNPPKETAKGRTFPKATRFSKEHDSKMRGRLGLSDKTPTTGVKKEDSYQHLTTLKEQYRNATALEWPITTLDDGRDVVILGGLQKDVTFFETLFRENSKTHMSGLNKMHEELLGDVTKELNMLLGNIDLLTDEVVSKEVQMVNTLFQVLKKTNQTLEKNSLNINQATNVR